MFAIEHLNLKVDVHAIEDLSGHESELNHTRVSILAHEKGLPSVDLPVDMLKDRLMKMITDVMSEKADSKPRV